MMMGANQMGGLGAIAGTPFAPIITALAKKLGINPIIASIVVGFLLKKLFESQSRHSKPSVPCRINACLNKVAGLTV
jgi:hypothetical protein